MADGTARVAVVGAGTAGAATSLFLARAGHDLTLFEAVERPAAIGAGIMLQPTGLTVLSRLGLLAPIVAAGHRIDRLRCVERNDRRLFDIEYADWDPDAFGLGIHRGALFETLFVAASEAVAHVQTGARIVKRIGTDRLADEDGQQYGPFDLIVVADGARSQLRQSLMPHSATRRYPWGALWFVAQDPEQHFRRQLLQRVAGAQQMIGLLPTGLPPNSDVPVVSLFISVRVDQAERIKRLSATQLAEQVVSVAPEAGQVLDQLQDPSSLLLAEYHDVRVRPLFDDRTVFLGDAAHAMSPQLGQGANLALWDAMALCDALTDWPAAPLEVGLRHFAQQRRSHLRFYQWMTRALTPFFQSDSRALGTLRNLLMPMATRVGWLRRQMVATMCGVKTGPLATLALPSHFESVKRLGP